MAGCVLSSLREVAEENELGGGYMEYRTAIVDECDCVMYWCSDLSGEEINEILDNHPEWWIRAIEV